LNLALSAFNGDLCRYQKERLLNLDLLLDVEKLLFEIDLLFCYVGILQIMFCNLNIVFSQLSINQISFAKDTDLNDAHWYFVSNCFLKNELSKMYKRPKGGLLSIIHMNMNFHNLVHPIIDAPLLLKL
jgi:hypothetical protein